MRLFVEQAPIPMVRTMCTAPDFSFVFFDFLAQSHCLSTAKTISICHTGLVILITFRKEGHYHHQGNKGVEI
jgi:hypothetical protein